MYHTTFDKWILVGVIISVTTTLLTNAKLCTEKICKYEFVVRESRSMMYAVEYPSGWQDVYDVALNGSRLTLRENSAHPTVPDVPHDVILNKTNTLDGVPAHMIVINDRFVGPTIEVMRGAHVVVKVVNNLQKQSLTLHWHGMHQRSTFYMDGVPYITQCPISPGQSFTYQFVADPAGTHWYHSHLSNQRADGLYGAIIVHREKPRLPHFELTISDWYHTTSTELETSNPYKTHDRGSGPFHFQTIDRDHSFDGVKLSAVGYVSGLINGRGRYDGNCAPLTRYEVTKGLTYRFHVVSATNEFAYQISIDHHKLKVVEMDGFSVEPVEVQSFIVIGGETYVFEVEANQLDNTSYWMRAETLKDGKGPFVRNDGSSKDKILAIFTYLRGASARQDPSTSPKNCTANEPCYVLNCFWKEFPEDVYPNRKCIPIDHMRLSPFAEMAKKTDHSILSPSEKVHEIFLNFAFSAGSSINNHRFIFPKSSPIYNSASTILKPCTAQCYDKGCKCTNVVKLPLNKTIQLVLMSYTTVNDMGKTTPIRLTTPSTCTVTASTFSNRVLVLLTTGLNVSPGWTKTSCVTTNRVVDNTGNVTWLESWISKIRLWRTVWWHQLKATLSSGSAVITLDSGCSIVTPCSIRWKGWSWCSMKRLSRKSLVTTPHNWNHRHRDSHNAVRSIWVLTHSQSGKIPRSLAMARKSKRNVKRKQIW